MEKKPKRYFEPVFKEYAQNQGLLLPPSLEELIRPNHPVRIVSAIIDQVNIDFLLKAYKGGGTSSFHPKLLLKVLTYAYVTNVYSSRKIEEACQNHIHFMWLCGMHAPDHNTINRFRSVRLKGVFKKVFTRVVRLLMEEGLISLKEIYVDGTKMESVANRYTFVWGKTIANNREKIKKQLEEIWNYAQRVAEKESTDPEPPDFTDIKPEKVKAVVEKLESDLRDNPNADEKVKAKLKRVKKDWPEQLQKYDEQEAILNGRSSYSKTDPDATFMRMKDDHLGTGQLKPAYNVQISTAGQFVLEYTIHSNASDTVTLIPHLQQLAASYELMPGTLTADAGYGSEENYEYLEAKGIEAFVKYNTYDQEQQEKENGKRPFTADKLFYNREQDCLICPMGQKMENIGTTIKKTTTGFEQTIASYQAKNCNGCPLRGVCHKGTGNRIIDINHNLNRHKERARVLLKTEVAQHHLKQRGIEPEPVFGNVKQNHLFKRLMQRVTCIGQEIDLVMKE